MAEKSITNINTMTQKELDSWFVSLAVKQKEHIACKVLLKQGKDPKGGVYPNCWGVWEELSEDIKNQIHSHCTDKHGMWIQEEGDGPIYSF